MNHSQNTQTLDAAATNVAVGDLFNGTTSISKPLHAQHIVQYGSQQPQQQNPRSDGTGTGMEHMMYNVFHFGYNETILFSWWHIETITGLIASMFLIFWLSFLCKALKYYRQYLFWKMYNRLEYRLVADPTDPTESTEPQPESAAQTTTSATVQQPSIISFNHILDTFLYIIQMTISYLLMLIFMTYNVWLCLAVAMGATVGFFLTYLFGKKSVILDFNEHCH